MGEVQWIKIYLDMFDKPKIKKVRRLPAGNDLLLIWIMLLVKAGKCNADGMIYITENFPYTEEDLADELGFDINTIRLALKAFEELHMITTSPDGFIDVIGWEEYQNIEGMEKIREQNRLRKQKQREKQKLIENVSRDSHGTVTVCHDTEEEIEEEKEKEEEFHSFVLARESEEDKTRMKRELMGGSLGAKVVMLSEEETDKLLEELSLDEFNHYVSVVRDCELNGQRFRKKTHYQAIMEMAMADRLKATKACKEKI